MMNESYRLPIKETIAEAWRRVDGAKGTIMAALGVIFLIGIGFAILNGILTHITPFLAILGQLVFQILVCLLQLGLMYIGIQRAIDQPITYKLVFRGLDRKIAISGILSYILVLLSVMVIPGILLVIAANLHGILNGLLGVIAAIIFYYMMIRTWLTLYFVVDQVATPIQAIKMSFAATRNHVWQLLGIVILVWLIVAISAIPFGIGLIWTIPLALICNGLVYKKLSGNIGR